MLTGNLATDTPGGNFTQHNLSLIVTPSEVTLAPVELAPPAKPPLTLTGSATPAGYTLHLLGTATPDQVRQLGNLMPPFAEGLDAVLPASASPPPPPAPAAKAATRLDITCTRVWSTGQTCTTNRTPPPAEPHPRRRH